jgi:hypothetical protein
VIRKRDQDGEAVRTVARLQGALEGYLAAGGGNDVSVSAAHLLDLINPRGMWSLDPERRRQQAAVGPPPGSDPLTGCLPVTHPGAAT